MKKVLTAVSTVALAGALAACGSSGGGGGSTPASGSNGASAASGESGTLTVFAAASLTEAFNNLKQDFEKSHPNVKVNISYGGSSTLVQQITNGAPADVFASADQKNMDKLTKAGDNAGQPVIFASNVLEIAVPQGNPKHITSLADLNKPGMSVVVCAPQVPCGTATTKVEQAAHVTLKPKSEEQDVKSVLSKVKSGDADAGLVYVSDVKTAGPQIAGVNFPQANAAVNQYPIVAVKGSKNSAAANDFIALITSAEGKKALTDAGLTAK